jgi:hypothetical protein
MPSGSAPIVQTGQYGVGGSGVYPSASVTMPRKSRMGLVIALLAVLAVGGGVAAFVMVGQKNNPTPTPRGSDGSQVVINDGSNHGEQAGMGRDAAVIEHDAAGPGSNIAGTDIGPGSGSNHAEQAGSGSSVETHDGSNAGSNNPPAAEVVAVLLVARNASAFEVYENGTKVLDGPDSLPVPKGEKRTVVIKANGFKEKPLVVDATKKKIIFALSRNPVVNSGSGATHPVNAGSGSGHVSETPPPPVGPDCSNKILDPKSKACISQYCAKHSDDDKCHME